MGQKQRKKEERPKVGNNNGKIRMANATSGGACKAAWAKMASYALQTPPRVAQASHLGQNVKATAPLLCEGVSKKTAG